MDGRTQGEVLVVDCDRVRREQLVAVLAGDGFSTREAATGEEGLEAALARRPDVVLLEVNLTGMCGYELLRRLREAFGESLPLVFTSADRTEPFDRVGGMLLGADDYLVRPLSPDELLARLRRLVRVSHVNGRGKAGVLTAREREVLELLAAGKDQREIATALLISPKTCAKHIERILEKLGVHSRAQAVAVAYRDELIPVRS